MRKKHSKESKPVNFTAFGVVIGNRLYQHVEGSTSECPACQMLAATAGHPGAPKVSRFIVADAKKFKVVPRRPVLRGGGR